MAVRQEWVNGRRMEASRALKAMWTVKAGILPNEPDERYTRVWELGGDEWGLGNEAGCALYWDIRDTAFAYAEQIGDPTYLNWVRLEWIWL